MALTSNVRTAIGLIVGLFGLAITIYFVVLITCGPWVERRQRAWKSIKRLSLRDQTRYPDPSNRLTQV